MLDQKKKKRTSEQKVHTAFFEFVGFYIYFCQSLEWSTEIVPIIFEKLPKELIYLFSIVSYKTLRSTVVLSLFLLS